MYAVNGILFNHESERRGETFVTRKITLAAARIAQAVSYTHLDVYKRQANACYYPQPQLRTSGNIDIWVSVPLPRVCLKIES